MLLLLCVSFLVYQMMGTLQEYPADFDQQQPKKEVAGSSHRRAASGC